MGDANFTKLATKFTTDEVSIFRAQSMQAIVFEKARASAKYGRTVSRNVYVVDFGNFSFTQFSYEGE